jgi:hypothetical protein
MVRETHMNNRFATNGNGDSPTSVGDLKSYLLELAYDILTLVELQVRLLLLDLKEASARAAIGLVLLSAMLAVMLGSVPVLLMACGEVLVEWAGWSRAASYGLVAVTAMAVAVVVGYLTFKKLKKVTVILDRSNQELQSNLNFVKSLMKKRPAPKVTPESSAV